MIRLVLFDIDGTLIKTGGAGEKAFARVCATEFDIPDGTRSLNFAGRTDPSIVRDFFGQFGIEASAKNFQKFFTAYVFWLEKILKELDGQVLPGVGSLIDGFAGMAKAPTIGLLTGNIRRGAELKLRRYGLWERFVIEAGAFGDDHEDRNGLAVIARDRCCSLLNCDLNGSEILVIGDTPRDVACGQAIGANVLAVATGNFSLDALRACNPTWIVPDLTQTSVELLS
jgi:phosphoglycolate phosphatase